MGRTSYSCRLCFSTGTRRGYFEIFSTKGIELNISEIVETHFRCQIHESDSLPNFICKSCWNTTKEFHLLYETVQSAQTEHLTKEVKLESNSDKHRSEPETSVELRIDEVNCEASTDESNAGEENYENVLETPPLDDTLADAIKLENDLQCDLQSTDKRGKKSTEKHQKKKHEKLVAENLNRFDMTCDECPASFISLQDARTHYMIAHDNSNGYIKCCNIKLRYPHNIIQHSKRHTNPINFECSDCGNVYLSSRSLKKHMKKHDKSMDFQKQNYECEICKKTFASKSGLKTHLESHGQGKKLDEKYMRFISDNFDMTCDLCETTFDSFFDARKHYKDVHDVSKGHIKCCATKLPSFWMVIDHINMHLNPNSMKCEICSKQLTSKIKLYQHMRRHKRAMEKSFICDVCGKAFSTKDTVSRHIFAIHVDSDPKFECEFCHKRFQIKCLLTNHIITVHSEKQPKVTCEYCGKGFHVKAHLRKHIQSHKDKSERLAQRKQCKYCGEWLLTSSGVYYHEQIHTSGVQKCDQCQMELPHKIALLAHIRTQHREPKFKCSYCEKPFSILSKLKDHEESHTRHKVYQCKFCSKVFALRSSRQTHQKRNHAEELKRNRELKKFPQFSAQI